MARRALAVVVAMVLLLSVIAGCSTSETSYSPRDLAETLPTQIGEMKMHPVDADLYDPSMVFGSGTDTEGLLDLFDRDVDDIEFAIATNTDPDEPSTAPAFLAVLAAMRVNGIDADELAKASVSMSLDTTFEERTVAGRTLYVGLGDGVWGFVYPKGDVLFMAISTSLDWPMTAALSALP